MTASTKNGATSEIFLGVCAYAHGSSVAFIQNDKILFAAEEERYSRRKNDDRFPSLAITAGLKQLQITQK